LRSSRIFRATWRALLLVAVFAVPALGASTVIDTFQGEDASVVDGKRVEPGIVFYTDGRVEHRIQIDDAANRLAVKADPGPKCGDQWPHMVVEVDGVPVLSTSVQESGVTWAPVNVAPGNHIVAVSYDNDYYEPVDAFASEPATPLTCDRNLTLDAIRLVATTPDPPSPPPGPAPPPTPPPSPQPPPGNADDILWKGDAEKAWDDSVSGKRWPDNNEWVDYSCADRSRFSQVTDRVAQGRRAYRIEVRDGDDSYGERCELANGNTDQSRLDYGVLFHRGQEAWIAFQIYLPLDYSFAPDDAPVSFPNDGGLITQLKQLGSCGTPALGIVSSRTVFALRNSAANYCESGAMRSLWRVPMVLGHWVKWVQHVRFDTDPAIGFISTWYDPDGLGLRPIIPTTDFGNRVVGNRIYTHTQKEPTDHPDPACPAYDVCSQARIGIYRDPDVSGTSVIYHDGWTVAKTRVAAESNAFAP
jgi:Polysaccharide lyase/Ca-dependent carbohydrate-binding module xylan-binding